MKTLHYERHPQVLLELDLQGPFVHPGEVNTVEVGTVPCVHGHRRTDDG